MNKQEMETLLFGFYNFLMDQFDGRIFLSAVEIHMSLNMKHIADKSEIETVLKDFVNYSDGMLREVNIYLFLDTLCFTSDTETNEISNEKIDQIIFALDQTAREYDSYEYGLPTSSIHSMDEMRSNIREILKSL